MEKPTFAELSAQERDFVDEQLTIAGELMTAYAAEETDRLKQLDAVWDGWRMDGQFDEAEVNGMINALGVAFGQALCDGAGLRWVIATDEHGSELALTGPSELVIYPQSFVAKRWERKEGHFFAASYRAIAEQVEQLSGSA